MRLKAVVIHLSPRYERVSSSLCECRSICEHSGPIKENFEGWKKSGSNKLSGAHFVIFFISTAFCPSFRLTLKEFLVPDTLIQITQLHNLLLATDLLHQDNWGWGATGPLTSFIKAEESTSEPVCDHFETGWIWGKSKNVLFILFTCASLLLL